MPLLWNAFVNGLMYLGLHMYLHMYMYLQTQIVGRLLALDSKTSGLGLGLEHAILEPIPAVKS